MKSGAWTGRRGIVGVRRVSVVLGIVCSIAAASRSTQNSTTSRGPDSTLLEDVAQRSDGIVEELAALRRDIHRHPELSGEEARTSKLVAERLRGLGLEVRTQVGGHGVVAVLEGDLGGPVVAYRADMDAVRSPRVPNTDFESEVEGVHHVCGHDAHVAVGLGVAEVLAGLVDRLPGTVVFLFQPAEETLEGAEDMLRDGAFRNPKPEAIFAVHSAPFPVGQVGCAPGHGLPGLQIYDIGVRGFDDPRAGAEQIVAAIAAQSTVQPPGSLEEFGTYMDALRTEGGGFLANYVFTWAQVESIADDGEIMIRGFVRAGGSPGVRGALMATRQMLFGLQAEGVSFEMRMDEPYPAMINEPALTRQACATVADVLGDDAVIPIYASHPFNGEDFAYYQELVPGSMFWLGVANPTQGITGIPHAPDFDIDERALLVGTKAMASVLVGYLMDGGGEADR